MRSSSLTAPRSHSSEDGAAAVEFALVASLLILMLLGITEFGRFYNQSEVYQSAAREGARLTAIGDPYTVGDVQTRVSDAAQPWGVPASAISVTVNGTSKTCDSTTKDQEAKVVFTRDITISLPFFRKFTKTSTYTGVFKCE